MKKDKVVWCNPGWMPGKYGFCPSEKAWAAELKALRVAGAEPYPTDDARVTSFKWTTRLCCLVTMNEEMDNRPLIGVIDLMVHEAIHVWQRLLEDAGETNPGREIEAYAVQNIVGNLLEAYSRTRRRIK